MAHETILGFRVVLNPLMDNQPRMQLSQKLKDIIEPYDPEFVEETNAWLLSFFGTESQVFVNKDDKVIFVGPKGWQTIKRDMEAQHEQV